MRVVRQRAWIVAGLLAMVAGCAPEPVPPAASASTGTGESGTPRAGRPARTGQDALHVWATYDRRIKAPPGGRLEFTLLDDATPIATHVLDDVAGPPFEAVLHYDATRLGRTGGRVRARLIGPDGETWFRGEAPLPVRPGRDDAVRIDLLPAPDDPEPASGPSG